MKGGEWQGNQNFTHFVVINFSDSLKGCGFFDANILGTYFVKHLLVVGAAATQTKL